MEIHVVKSKGARKALCGRAVTPANSVVSRCCGTCAGCLEKAYSEPKRKAVRR